MAKLKLVIIRGPFIYLTEPSKALYSKKGFLIIDPGEEPMSLQKIEKDLLGKIDSGTRIEIHMHGAIKAHGEYRLLCNSHDRSSFTSAEIFKLLSRLAQNAPLEVHLRACQSQAALKDIDNLSKGSVLFTYALEDGLSCSAIDNEACSDITARIQGVERPPENVSKLDLQFTLENVIFRMPSNTIFAISGIEGGVSFNPDYNSNLGISEALSRFYAESCKKISELDLSESDYQFIILPPKTQTLDHSLMEEAVNWNIKSWFFKQCVLSNHEFLEFLQENPKIILEMLTKKVGTQSVIGGASYNSNNSEIFKYLWQIAKTKGMQISEFFDKDSPHFVARFELRNETLDCLLEELREFTAINPGVLSAEQYSMLLFSVLTGGEGNEIALDKFFKIATLDQVDLKLLLTTECEIQDNKYTFLGAIAEAGTAKILRKILEFADSIGADMSDQLLIPTGLQQMPLHAALYYPDRPAELVVDLYNFALQRLPNIAELLATKDIFGKTPFDYDLGPILALHADASHEQALMGQDYDLYEVFLAAGGFSG